VEEAAVKEPFAEGHPYLAGETVTEGTFRCERCGHEHEVSGHVTNLPVCPQCQNDTWRAS
jgi:Zn finger protein HypA/HybF involved in hydrogenase expression